MQKQKTWHGKKTKKTHQSKGQKRQLPSPPKKRIDSPETNPHIYGQLTYDRSIKHIKWGKDGLFNKWYWENCTATFRKVKLDYITPYKKLSQNGLKT